MWYIVHCEVNAREEADSNLNYCLLVATDNAFL